MPRLLEPADSFHLTPGGTSRRCWQRADAGLAAYSRATSCATSGVIRYQLHIGRISFQLQLGVAPGFVRFRLARYAMLEIKAVRGPAHEA